MSAITLPDGRVVEIEREVIETTSLAPRPDPDWHYTDAAGHEHYWDNGWPTLTHVVDSEDWIDEDGEEYPGESHWECTICGEHITLGMRGPDPFRTYMPGTVRATVDGEPVTEAEALALIDGVQGFDPRGA